jgi:hypothetical protein
MSLFFFAFLYALISHAFSMKAVGHVLLFFGFMIEDGWLAVEQ